VDIVGGIAGWLGDVFDQIRSISVPILLFALALHTCETLLNAVAWRRILGSAYRRGGVQFGPVLGAYGGGIALNAVLPAQAGTVAMLGLFRAQIRGSTVPGVIGAGVVQNAFFAVVGLLVCLVLVVTRPASFDIKSTWLTNHPLLAIGAAVVAAIAARILVRRHRHALAAAKEGAAILATPRRYASQVLTVEAASYLMRMAVTATFMFAYDVPVSVRAVLLIIAANSISSTFAATPGGVGTQQALATAALRNYAPASVVTAYSLGQQLIIAAWDVALGFVLLWFTIGWIATRDLIRDRNRAPATQTPAEVEHQAQDPATQTDD
jgi:uncharacterized membrane protein YbhN (UPF0104 family)